MQNGEKELEKYLSEFKPRAMRPLEVQNRAPVAQVRRLAAAAVVLLSASVGLWYANHAPQALPAANGQNLVHLEVRVKQLRSNSIILTKLALEDEKQFAAALEVESRDVLPDFQTEQSALKVLAKE